VGAAELERRAVVDDGVEVTKELAAAVAEDDPADETSAPGAVLAAAAACGLTPERRLVCILILHKALHPLRTLMGFGPFWAMSYTIFCSVDLVIGAST
jgi:hypothetical protein